MYTDHSPQSIMITEIDPGILTFISDSIVIIFEKL